MVDDKTLRAAVAALGIDVPVLTARVLEGGVVELTTRNGVHTWQPDKPKTPVKRKPRSRKKASDES